MAGYPTLDKIVVTAKSKVASLRVDGDEVGTVPVMMLARIGLREGAEWSPETIARVQRANEVATALARAARLHAASPKTRAEVIARLVGAGIAEDVAAEAHDMLSEIVKTSDEAVKDVVLAKAARRGESRAMVQERLEARGIEVPADMGHERDAARVAARLAANRVPPKTDAVTRWRRVLGALARKGFGEDEAMAAAREVLGAPPEGATHEG